ncbi:phosphatidate cytidylyltransferase [Bdellovibrionota bacterium FG-1]
MNSELSKRVSTGVVGGAFLLALIIWGGWIGIFVLTVILSLGMLFEYAKMTLTLSDQVEKRYALLCVSWFSSWVLFLVPRSEFETLIFCILGLFLYFLLTAWRHTGAAFTTHFNELALSVLGLIYLSFLPFFLPRIHQAVNGIEWTIVFLLIVFAGDTGAYFTGKKYGHTKLYPVISPKKTREGAMGGLAAGYVLALIAKLTFFREMPWAAVFVTPGLVGVMAQLGDLCESLIKRAYHTKDSGSILPGHGGFLDRFDGVVFSLPVMYACIRFLN